MSPATDNRRPTSGQSANPAIGNSAMLGVYIHIPFCSAICNYCNFNRGLYDEGAEDALRRGAARRRSPRVRRAGRAPPRRTRSSSAAVPRRCCQPDDDRARSSSRSAIAFDVDRRRGGHARNQSGDRRPRQAGTFPRGRCQSHLSFGVQSFQDDELKRLGRIHSADRARAAVREARAAGFDNVSLDLMMWLPGQSVETWLGERRRADRGGARPCVAVSARALPERAAERGDGARWLVAGAGRRRGGDVPPGDGAARNARVSSSTRFRMSQDPAGRRATTSSTGPTASGLLSVVARTRRAAAIRWKNVSGHRGIHRAGDERP